MDGHGNRREYAREALWGIDDAFSTQHSLFRLIRDLTLLRSAQPAFRYGRQYFRRVSGNGNDFGHSPFKGGVIAYSRILNDKEVLVVANTNTSEQITVHVVVDNNINPHGQLWTILFPFDRHGDHDKTSRTHGVYRTIEVTLAPMEVLVMTGR